MTDKIVLGNIATFQNDSSAATQYNANNAALTVALDNTLSRDGTSPNQMQAPLDMNSQPILNLPTPVSTTSPLRVLDATTLAGGSVITVSPLPTGGSTGQVLGKNSPTNFDVSWQSPTAISITGSSSLTLGSNILGTVALSGDVTSNSNSFATTISSGAVTNSKFRISNGLSLVGNPNSGSGSVIDIQGVSNQIPIVNNAGNALGFTSITGDIANSGGTFTVNSGAITGGKISTNTVANTNLLTTSAATLKGNPTAGSTTVTDFTIQGLTNKVSPSASLDAILLWDHTSGTFQYSTPGAIAGSNTAGVASIDGLSGSFTTANGLSSTSNVLSLTAARRTLPTRQIFTTGSGTYTTPTNCLWIEVMVVGGGGGGGGGNNVNPGNSGGNSAFGGILLASAGIGGSASNLIGAAGGSATGGDLNFTGGSGSCVNYSLNGTLPAAGGNGGNSILGGGGAGGNNGPGSAGIPNTGGGGGGGGNSNTIGSTTGGGGSSGGTVIKIINSPSATYTYAVGAGGAGATNGTGGGSGAAGAAGIVIVTEHYGT